MTGRLILVAHAETAATRRAAFPSDEPLSIRGHAAAARFPTFLPTATVSRSPAVAAAETAAAFGCEAAIDPMLSDLDCGRWRGQTIAAVADAEPKHLAAWLSDPAFAGHGGTSIDDVFVQVAAWIEARRDARGVTLAITHAAVIRCAVLAALGASTSGFWRVDVAPLTRVDLSSDGRRWVLRQIVQADQK